MRRFLDLLRRWFAEDNAGLAEFTARSTGNLEETRAAGRAAQARRSDPPDQSCQPIELPVLRNYDPNDVVGTLRIRAGVLAPDTIMALGYKVDKYEARGDEVHVTEFTPVSVGMFPEANLARTGTRLDHPSLTWADDWRRKAGLPPSS